MYIVRVYALPFKRINLMVTLGEASIATVQYSQGFHQIVIKLFIAAYP